MAKSAARASFDAAIVIVQSLAALEKKYKDPPTSADANAVEGLRAACAVLIVAAFEEFTKQCFTDELSKLTLKPTVFSKLPEKLQTEAVYKQLSLAMEGSGKKFERLPKVMTASGRVFRGEIHPESFARTAGNPTSETISNMFKDVSVSSFFETSRQRFEAAWGKPISKTFAKDKLNEIVARRHQVAHSGRALSVSRLDLHESIRFIKKLVPVLEAELRVHIRTLAQAARP